MFLLNPSPRQARHRLQERQPPFRRFHVGIRRPSFGLCSVAEEGGRPGELYFRRKVQGTEISSEK
jgi:hypothetical protein